MDKAMCDLRPSVTYQNGPSKAVFLNTEYDVAKKLVDKTCSGNSHIRILLTGVLPR